MRHNYLSIRRFGTPITILISLIFIIIHPTWSPAFCLALITYSLLKGIVGNQSSILISLSLLFPFNYLYSEALNTISIDPAIIRDTDSVILFIVIATSISSLFYDNKKVFPIFLSAILTCSSFVLFAQNERLIREERATKELESKREVTDKLQKINDKELLECAISGKVGGYACLIYQEKYPFPKDDNNLSNTLNSRSNQYEPLISWTQKEYMRESPFSENLENDTDFDVIDIAIGILNEGESSIILAKHIYPQEYLDNEEMKRAFSTSMLLLLIFSVINALRSLPNSISFYLLGLCNLLTLIMSNGLPPLSTTITVVAIGLSILYEKSHIDR